MRRKNNNFQKIYIKAVIFFFLWSSFCQSMPSLAQQPFPSPGMVVPQAGPNALSTQPASPVGMPAPQGTFPILTDLTATPGDTYVDLKWTPFWKEEVKRPSRPAEIQKLLDERVGEAVALKEKQMRLVPGIEKPTMLRPEEKSRIKKEEAEKAKEKIPEEGEIAGYIIYFGKDSKTYTNKLDVGLVTTYRLRGLNNFSTYFFVIQAYTKARELSELSREVSATPKEEKDLLSPIERSFFEEKIPQVVSREIKQFGYDFFLAKTSSFAPIADVPVGPDYVIGAGDAFTITLWGRLEASFAVEVDPNGEISLPRLAS